jgi:lysophospholipase L1-like esterase
VNFAAAIARERHRHCDRANCISENKSMDSSAKCIRRSAAALLTAAFCLLLADASAQTPPAAAPSHPTGSGAPTAGASATQQPAESMTSGPAPAGKPWEPGWGFWPKVPAAWQQTHQSLVDRIRSGPAKIVFIGDSLTKGWAEGGKEIWQQCYAPLDAANLGIGGDTTRQILWRLAHGALDGAKPKVIVLMIGVNNIFTGTGNNGEIVQGVEAILQRCQAKCPESRILLLGIGPVGNNKVQDERVRAINQLLSKLEGGPVRFLELGPHFRDPNGAPIRELFSDHAHLSKAGYATWAQAMQPVLDELLK